MKHYFISIFKDSKRQSLYASFPRWYKERGIVMLPNSRLGKRQVIIKED